MCKSFRIQAIASSNFLIQATMATAESETATLNTFDAFFDELRTDLGEDNFRNFLVALSGRKPKEGRKRDRKMGKFHEIHVIPLSIPRTKLIVSLNPGIHKDQA